MLRYVKIFAFYAVAATMAAMFLSLALFGVAATSLYVGFVILCAVMGGIGLLLYLLAIHVAKSVIFAWRLNALLGWTGWPQLAARFWYSFKDAPPMVQRRDNGKKIYWPGMRKAIDEKEARHWATFDAENNEVSDNG